MNWKFLIPKPDSRGFTLVEVIVGSVISLIAGYLMLETFVALTKQVADDRQKIKKTQTITGLLQTIGEDIKAAGEGVASDRYFPRIEFGTLTGTDFFNNIGSGGFDISGYRTLNIVSQLTIRRTALSQLTLCQAIDAGNVSSIIGNDWLTVGTEGSTVRGCSGNPKQSSTTKLPILPANLRELRDYRCNFAVAGSIGSYTIIDTGVDKCIGAGFGLSYSQQLPLVISDLQGRYSFLMGIGERVNGNDYQIKVFPYIPPNLATRNNIIYPVGSPIYVVEDRTYALDDTGDLWLYINYTRIRKLASNVAKFQVSGRLYDDIVSRSISTSPPNPCLTDTKRVCQFNQNVASEAPYDGLSLATVKVRIELKSNPAPTTSAELERLSGDSEFSIINNF
jgi:prepilin-type N-terminal cleavage/methylation domain-containing protein